MRSERAAPAVASVSAAAGAICGVDVAGENGGGGEGATNENESETKDEKSWMGEA